MQRAILGEVVHVQARRLGRRGADVRVQAQVAEHEIRAPIAPQVRCHDAVPPATRARESGLRRAIDESSVDLPEDPNRHPLAHHHEIETARAAGRNPRRGRDHPAFGQRGCARQRDVGESSGPVVPEQMTPRRDAVLLRHDTASDEQVHVPIAIEVARHHARRILEDGRERRRIAAESPAPVVQVQAAAQRIGIAPELVAATGDDEVDMAIAIRVEERSVDIFGDAVRGDRWLQRRLEAAIAPLHVERAGLPFRATHVHVVQPVAVHVGYRKGRPLARQQMRHQRLAIVVVVRVLDMPAAQSRLRRDVREQRGRWSRRGEREFPGRRALLQRDQAVGRDVRHRLEPVVRPDHGERIDDRRGTESEVQARIDRRLKAARRHLFQRLHRGAVTNDHPSTDSPGVRALAAQLDGKIVVVVHLARAVTVDGRRRIHVVHDEVQCAAVVQVDVDRTIGETGLREPPRRRSVGEGEVAVVPECEVGQRNLRHLLQQRHVVPRDALRQ